MRVYVLSYNVKGFMSKLVLGVVFISSGLDGIRLSELHWGTFGPPLSRCVVMERFYLAGYSGAISSPWFVSLRADSYIDGCETPGILVRNM